jgi:hypothetical protein
MQLPTPRMRSHPEFVEVGFTIQSHAFIEGQASAGRGAVE